MLCRAFVPVFSLVIGLRPPSIFRFCSSFGPPPPNVLDQKTRSSLAMSSARSACSIAVLEWAELIKHGLECTFAETFPENRNASEIVRRSSFRPPQDAERTLIAELRVSAALSARFTETGEALRR
jgi:hypothetical protein